jgi:hypothetical protein
MKERKPSKAKPSFIDALIALPKRQRLDKLAALERSGRLAKKLAGTKYILADGTIAAITLAKDMGLTGGTGTSELDLY